MSDAGLLEEFLAGAHVDAADDLTARLAQLGPAVRAVRRLKAADYLCGGSPATTG
jgi:hypothetical protein